jgi:acyl-coenzyme A thioesterase PaaI-like protein
MKKIIGLIEKAKASKFHLWMLNTGLNRMIPFNKPHGLRILEIGDHYLKSILPYKHRNFNHIRGIHACALATLSEFTTGFLLLINLDAAKYRLIMQKLTMEYHYQAKMDAFAYFSVDEKWMQEKVTSVLQSAEKVAVDCTIEIYDSDNNHLATGTVTWQIKNWSKVKTKM